MPQNGINHPGVTALAKAMQHNSALRILNLNDNTFTEKGAIAMAQVHRPNGMYGRASFTNHLSTNLVSKLHFVFPP